MSARAAAAAAGPGRYPGFDAVPSSSPAAAGANTRNGRNCGAGAGAGEDGSRLGALDERIGRAREGGRSARSRATRAAGAVQGMGRPVAEDVELPPADGVMGHTKDAPRVDMELVFVQYEQQLAPVTSLNSA